MNKGLFILFFIFLLTGSSGYLPAKSFLEKPYSVSFVLLLKDTGVITEAADFWTGPPDMASSMVFLKLAKGTEVEILSRENDYYKVMHRNLIGYVEKRVVKVAGAEEEAPALPAEELITRGSDKAKRETAPAAPLWHKVTKATSLRAAPDSQAKVYVRLYDGYRVQVLENSGRWWWKVRYKGREGWAKAALLERE